MKDPRFRRGLKISTAVHVAVLVLLAAWPLLNRWVHPPKPPELITFVELMAGDPAPPAPAPVVPQPKPEPKPKPEPEPEPKPEPVPEPKPIVETPPKPDKPKIKVNTNRIVRKTDVVPPKPVKPTLTKAQIEQALNQSVRFTSVGGTPGGSTSALAAYFAQVREAMYAVWRQPSGAGASGIRTQVRVKVVRGGGVVSRQLVSGSGSAVMDASVMNAVQSVSRLPPLPADISGDDLEIVVEFVLEGP